MATISIIIHPHCPLVFSIVYFFIEGVKNTYLGNFYLSIKEVKVGPNFRLRQPFLAQGGHFVFCTEGVAGDAGDAARLVLLVQIYSIDLFNSKGKHNSVIAKVDLQSML